MNKREIVISLSLICHRHRYFSAWRRPSGKVAVSYSAFNKLLVDFTRRLLEENILSYRDVVKLSKRDPIFLKVLKDLDFN